MSSIRHLSLARWCAALPLAAAGLAQAQTVTAVQVCECLVTDISTDGKAATGLMNGSYETFRWTLDGGLTLLGRATLPVIGTTSGMPSISGDGKKVAATVLDDTGTKATAGLWGPSNGWRMLAKPLPADGGQMDTEDSSVWGMSRDGKVVVGLYWRGGQTGGGSAHGYAWQTETGMVGYATAGGSARIDDASKDGSVQAGWEEDSTWGGRRAAVWVNGVRTFLDKPQYFGEAEALTGDGLIAVGQSMDAESGMGMAAKWKFKDGGWKRKLLGVLPGTDFGGWAYANAVSEDGKIVVGLGAKVFGPVTNGFVWTEAAGMEAAVDFFKAKGYYAPRYDIKNVIAVTPNGQTFAVVELMKRSPYTQRTVLVTLPATPAP
ncbi:hypothetical protein [Ideonella sp.]|uniref:hypothetical protein n=1 Tax=Ideonella sp. TaxID=1929293 RepID=UPI003BB6FE2F